MDIDIDFYDRSKILDIIEYIPATIVNKMGEAKPHNSGVYCQQIPVNPLNNLSSIDYKEAESRGYFKIDFLNAAVYKGVRDEAHLNELLSKEPLWDLLEQKEFTDLLFHINGHHTVLKQMKPKSIPQLAAVLAMIRPAKRHLIGKEWTTIMKTIWTKTSDDKGYAFKSSHAHAYATAIVVQMNLICESISNGYS
jgi:DNA polymerase III alpha subunit